MATIIKSKDSLCAIEIMEYVKFDEEPVPSSVNIDDTDTISEQGVTDAQQQIAMIIDKGQKWSFKVLLDAQNDRNREVRGKLPVVQ